MQNLIYVMIFAFLTSGAFFVAGIKLFRRKTTISLSRQVLSEKKKQIDERFVKLSRRERLMTAIESTVTMSGSNMNNFWLLVLFSGAAGFGLGKFLFTVNSLALMSAVILLPMPYLYFKVKSRWYKRNQDDLLENTMSMITNTYVGCNDIIKAVNDNLYKLDIQKPFAEFITDVTLIDSNVRRALRRLELKIGNKYFSEWIDILVLAQEKSGDMRFILPTVVDGMNDAKRLQIEADTLMMNVWKEYFMSIALAFSIIPILRTSNAQWFEILVTTMIGKILIILMLLMTLTSAFIVLRINKPL